MPNPRLRRFDQISYKALSPTDSARVPAAGATLQFYRQATVLAATTVNTTPVDVSVSDSGGLKAGDLVKTPAYPSAELLAIAIATPTIVRLAKTFGPPGGVPLTPGMRLLAPADLYLDPFGTDPLGSEVSADEDGRAVGYVEAEWFDYIVLDGVSERYFPDAIGRIEVQSRWGANARDYQSLDDALTAMPSGGGLLNLPTGEYVTATGLAMSQPNVILAGQGLETIIRPQAQVNGFDLLAIRASRCAVRDLRLGKNNEFNSGYRTRSALVVDPGFQGVTLENLQMEGGTTAGLMLPADLLGFRAVGCQCLWNQDGVLVTRSGAARLGAEFFWFVSGHNFGIGVRFNDGGGAPPRTQGVLRFVDCSFEGNHGGLVSTQGNAISVEGAGMHLIELRGCYFENPAPVGSQIYPVSGQQFVFLHQCDSAIVDGCYFFNAGSEGQPRLEKFVHYSSCERFRHSNNVTPGPIGAQILLLASDGAEFGNSNLFPPEAIPPIVADMDSESAYGLLSLSAGAVSLYRRVPDPPPSPLGLRPGSMIWVANAPDPPNRDKSLQVLYQPPLGDAYWREVWIE